MSLVSAAVHSAPGHRMAMLHSLPVAGPAPPPAAPEPAESALSSLSRLGHNALALSHPSRPSSRRQPLSRRSAKPLLSVEPQAQPHAKRPAATSKTDYPAASVRRESPDSGSPPLDSPLPHFAADMASPGMESSPGSSGPGPAPFWTLKWSSALEAVENVLHFAQGLNISFLPQPGVEGEEEAGPKLPDEDKIAPSSLLPVLSEPHSQQSRVPSARAHTLRSPSSRKEALRAELDALELMLRPKCPWPRQEAVSTEEVSDKGQWEVSAFLTEAPTADVAPETLTALGPRCAWPRESGKVRPLVSGSSTGLLSAAEAYPRCAWPRANKQLAAAAPAVPLEVVEMVAYPRCAWPRTVTEALVYPRRAWPRAASSAASRDTSVAAAALTNLASVALVAAAVAHAPRCAWPRERKAVASLSVATSSLAGDLLLAGPRCSWPRRQSSLEVAAPSGGSAPRCAWPRTAGSFVAVSPALPAGATAVPMLTAEVETVVEGPRCAWPRKAAGLPSLEIVPKEKVLGPRCFWPRKTGTSLTDPRDSAVDFGFDSASVPASQAVSAVGVQMAPRCAWPRGVKAEPATLLELGPRCAWPRAAKAADVALVQPPPVMLDAPGLPLGPRCAWPRLASAPANSPAVAEPVPSLVEGPRCAWPRKQAASAAPATSTVEETPIAAGPRCAWPRGGVVPAVEPKVPEADAGAGPSSAEDMAWEVLPAMARDAGRKRVPHLTAAALPTSTNGAPVHGARCPWPRPARQSAPGILGSSS